jgi:hypothetical protein
MSEIIKPEEFDKIFDKIIYPQKLRKEISKLFVQRKADINNKVDIFLKENCYRVCYENQEFFVMTDTYYNNL